MGIVFHALAWFKCESATLSAKAWESESER